MKRWTKTRTTRFLRNCALVARLSLDGMAAIAACRGGRCLSTEYRDVGTPLLCRYKAGHQWTATSASAWGPEVVSFLRPQSSARTPSDAISLTGKVPLNRPSKLVRVASFLLREQFTVVFFQPRVEKQNPGLGALPSNRAQIAEASRKHALLRRFPSRQSLPSGLSTNSNLRLCLDSTRLRCPTSTTTASLDGPMRAG